MNKATVIEWYDDVNPDSYVLCQEAYGIKVLQTKTIDANTTEVVVYGPTENIDHFLEDFNEDCVQPLESMQAGDYDDEDYEAYLNNEVNRWFMLNDLDVFANADVYGNEPETDHTEINF